MPKTLIVSNNYERARNYARKYGYTGADIVGGDVNQLRGRHTERLIIVGELDEHTKQIITPMMAGGDTEVLYGN